MANIASQKKRILRSERERLENRRYTSALKTQFRHLEDAVKAGDTDAVAAAHSKYVSLVGKSVKSGALHRNTGSRKVARAARLVKSASAS
jgi:small subunit ribosomal protein S20